MSEPTVTEPGPPPVRAAVVPCAGLGTRLQPATLAVPKELLPLGVQPALCATLLEAVGAGIEELVVVAAPGKDALRRFLDPDCWPEGTEAPAARALAGLLGRLRVRTVEQPLAVGALDGIARGLALCGEPAAVLYPDLVHLPDQRALPQVLAGYQACGQTVFGLHRADLRPLHGPSARVVVAGSGPLHRIDHVEPPDAPPRPGELRTTFGLVHTPALSEALERLARPSPSAPLEDRGLIPTLEALARAGGLYGVLLSGEVLDLGTAAGYRDAQARFATGAAVLRAGP